MKKILFVDKLDLKLKVLTGGEIISKRNLEILRQTNCQIDTINLVNYKNKIETFYNSVKKYSNGLTSSLEKKIITLIKEEKYTTIFLGSSNLGRLAERIKKEKLEIKIITFFHNSETDFVNGYIKDKNILYKFLKKSVVYNESRAVKYSNILIGLNKRDSNSVNKNYGKFFDEIFPTTFEDVYNKNRYKNMNKKDEIDFLFVGSDFYGNAEGMKWFIDSCLNEIRGKLVIVGKGMEKYRDDYIYENLEILGTVDDLSEYYYRAKAVVLPIISGSGMKTKTCEALMFGKNIFGTFEAFEGYDLDFDKVGGVCKDSKEFIEKLNSFLKSNMSNFNNYSRDMYLQNYNTKILIDKLRNIID